MNEYLNTPEDRVGIPIEAKSAYGWLRIMILNLLI